MHKQSHIPHYFSVFLPIPIHLYCFCVFPCLFFYIFYFRYFFMFFLIGKRVCFIGERVRWI